MTVSLRGLPACNTEACGYRDLRTILLSWSGSHRAASICRTRRASPRDTARAISRSRLPLSGALPAIIRMTRTTCAFIKRRTWSRPADGHDRISWQRSRPTRLTDDLRPAITALAKPARCAFA